MTDPTPSPAPAALPVEALVEECQECAKALGPCKAHYQEEWVKWLRGRLTDIARAAHNCGIADAGRSFWYGPTDYPRLIDGLVEELFAAFAAQARRTEEAERELRRVVQETGGDPETWMGAAQQVRSRMCEHDQLTAERRELQQRLAAAESDALREVGKQWQALNDEQFDHWLYVTKGVERA